MCWFFNFSQKQMGNWLPAEVSFLLFFFELFLFIKFLAAGSPLLCGLPPFSASRGCSSARCAASHRRGLACGAQALGRAGFSSAAPRHGHSGCDAHGLVAPGHGGPSWIRDQTRVSCFGSWILYHWASREALWHRLLLKAFRIYFGLFRVIIRNHGFGFLQHVHRQILCHRISFFSG